MKIRTGFVSNSSSEAFLCRTECSIKETREILQKMLTFHNDTFGHSSSFEDTFEDPRIATEQDINMLEDYGYRPTPESYTSIMICSADDNSVPYELFDLIDSKFNAWRVHLG